MKYLHGKLNRLTSLSVLGLIVLALFLLQSRPFVEARQHATRSISTPLFDQEAQARLVETYGKLPLRFEANQGQVDPQVRFLSRGRSYSLLLSGSEAVLKLGKPSAMRHQQPDHRNPKLIPRLNLGLLTEPDSLFRAATGPDSNFPSSSLLRMKLVDARPAAKVTGLDELTGKTNYFIGNDPKKWRVNVPGYSKVKYESVYAGIDLVYYGNQQQLEYDFVVAPGADPRAIVLSIDADGLQKAGNDGPLQIDKSGNLVIQTAGGEVQFHKPVVYQQASSSAGGTPESYVDGHYVLLDARHVGFEVGAYDRCRPLIIDPVLSYSTYLGGSEGDEAVNLATDFAGNAYVVGITHSDDFPTTPGAYDTSCGTDGSCNASFDVFLTKLNPTGTAIVYSTYLGGSSLDWGTGIAVDLRGNAYVTGLTLSDDFPTQKAIQPAFSGIPQDCSLWDLPCGDAFVTKISANGSGIVYSTYLGGSRGDYALGIAVDPSANAYVTGFTISPDFPLQNAFQSTCGGCAAGLRDAFVTKLNKKGTALIYSTYLGGTGDEEGDGIAADFFGNAYAVGGTCSNDFPVANAIQPINLGGCAATITKFSPNGSRLIYSTYLGGSGGAFGSSITTDFFGNAFVTGGAGPDFPTTPGAFQEIMSPPSDLNPRDAFVTKLNAAGSRLVYSTYLGGDGNEWGEKIAVDSSGNTYVTGKTQSTDFPTARPIQAASGGGPDAFVSMLNPAGSRLKFSTYLGGNGEDWGRGLGLDSKGNVYLAGRTLSSNFPVANPIHANIGGTEDAFVSKINPRNGP